jgi:hypothetical protein
VEQDNRHDDNRGYLIVPCGGNPQEPPLADGLPRLEWHGRARPPLSALAVTIPRSQWHKLPQRTDTDVERV